MNSTLKTLLVIVFIFLVISACFIDPVDAAKKKKKDKDTEKVAKKGSVKGKGAKATAVPAEPTYEIKGGDNDEIDPESMAKIQARIKEKGYGKIIADHQAGRISDEDPIYKDMIDDLVKQTVKIELTPLGTEILEERPLTPEEIEIEMRREREEAAGRPLHHGHHGHHDGHDEL